MSNPPARKKDFLREVSLHVGQGWCSSTELGQNLVNLGAQGSCPWQQMKSSFSIFFSKFTKCLSMYHYKITRTWKHMCNIRSHHGLLGGGHLPPLLPKVSLCSKRSLAGTGEVKLPRNLFGLQLVLFLQIFQGCSLQKDHQFELVFVLYTGLFCHFLIVIHFHPWNWLLNFSALGIWLGVFEIREKITSAEEILVHMCWGWSSTQ